MKIYAKDVDKKEFAFKPDPEIKYEVCVLYKKQPTDPDDLVYIISSRNPSAIADMTSLAVHSLLKEHTDAKLPEKVSLNDYHELHFQDEKSAVRFIKRQHLELKLLKRGDTGNLEGLSNHLYHVHVGKRDTYFFRTDERTPVYVLPCDGNCDDDLSKVIKGLGCDVYRDEEAFIAADDDEVIKILEGYKEIKRYVFIIGEHPEKGLFLPQSIKNKVSDLEVKNQIGCEEVKDLGLRTVDINEQVKKELAEYTEKAIERMRKRGRQSRNPNL